MKAETARLLRAVLRLIETDVRELSDAVVEIDEREAAHYGDLTSAVEKLRHRVEHPTDNAYLSNADMFSRKVPS